MPLQTPDLNNPELPAVTGTPEVPLRTFDLYVPEEQPVSPAAPQGLRAYELGTTSQVKPTTFEDIGSSLKSGALRGVAALKGTPGSALYYGNKLQDYLFDRPSDTSNLNLPPEDASLFSREDRQRIREGLAAPGVIRIPGEDPNAVVWPTITGAIQEFEKEYPSTRYEPTTMLGSGAKTGAEFAVQNVPMGGLRTLGTRLLTGFGSGVGAEYAGDVGSLAGPYGEVAGNLFGAVVGDIATRKFGTFAKNLAMPDAQGAELLAKAAAEDLAADPELAARLETAIKNGEKIQAYDYLGPRSKSILGKYYTEDQLAFVNQFNKNLSKRSEGVTKEMEDFFSSNFGGDLRDETFASRLLELNNAERKKLYKAMENLPHAQSVWTPEIDGVLQNKLVSDAAITISEAAKNGELPKWWGVQAPDFTPPVNGVPQQFIFNPYAPPNIQYWDQVQRQLRALEDAAKKSTDPKMVGKADTYREARRELLDALEAQNAVPEFANVRNRAAELFGAENSLEGGFKMAQKLGGKNPFKVDEFMSNFDSLTPEQKNQFAQGAARYVFGQSNSGVSKVVSYLENPEVKDVLTRVMGQDKFNAMYGKTISGSIKQDAEALSLAAQSRGIKINPNEIYQYFVTTLIGGAGGVGASMLTNPNMATVLGAAGLTAGAAAKIVYSAAEKKAGRQALELAMSAKPEDAKKLGALINSNYDAASALMKQSDLARTTWQAIFNSTLKAETKDASAPEQLVPVEPLSIPMEENRGGRVERKAGGRVGSSSICAEVNRTRLLLGQKTASMLSMPDDAIVSALHIAKTK